MRTRNKPALIFFCLLLSAAAVLSGVKIHSELKERQKAGATEIQEAKEKAATAGKREDEEEEIPETGKETPKEKKNALKNAYNWLKRFFGKAPGKDGAALEW